MLLKMTTDKVAYLITYISYSCVYNYKGTIDEELLEQFLLDEICEYIINNSCSTKFVLIDDVKKFWERYGGCNVWEAYCVKNNNWINVKPKDEDILLNINEMTKSYESFEEILHERLEESLEESLEENLEESLEEVILKKTIDSNKNKYKNENENNDNDEDENEIENIDEDEIEFTISDDSFSEILLGEDIEIDWNTISIQEQEEQEENWKE
jgi:hypothetical protein